MFLIRNIPSGWGSLYEYHSAVLKAIETIPSACHHPKLTDCNKDKHLYSPKIMFGTLKATNKADVAPSEYEFDIPELE